MTIKQQGGIFGRNPTFNDAEVSNDLSIGNDLSVTGDVEVSNNAPRMYFMESDASDLNTRLINSAGSFVVQTANDAKNSHSTILKVDHSNNDVSLFNGNLVIATSGQGIDFSATSGTGTSELFDDYEEGTWTPVVSDSSSGGNTASGTLSGYYTKIGNRVLVDCSLTNVNTSGMTAGNDLFITGLPFTTANVSGTVIYTGSIVMHSVATSGNPSAGLQDNQDFIRIFETVSAAAFDFTTVGDLTSGSADIRFSLAYEAA